MVRKLVEVISCIVLCGFIVGCGNTNDLDNNINNASVDDSLNKDGTLTCVRTTTDDDGSKINEKMVIAYEDNIVKKVTNSLEIEMDPEYMELSLGMFEIVLNEIDKVDGINASVEQNSENTILEEIEVDIEKLDFNALEEDPDTEVKFVSSFKNKDVTLEEFKAENLDGYSCE